MNAIPDPLDPQPTDFPLTRPWEPGPIGMYKTYGMSQQPDREVKAACQDVGCEHWLDGWQTTVDESTTLGAGQASFIRWQSGRTFREQKTGDGRTVFTFERHQRCFREHKTRPQLFGVRDGDHRGNPSGRRLWHANGRDWVEDFGEHQQRVADQAARG